MMGQWQARGTQASDIIHDKNAFTGIRSVFVSPYCIACSQIFSVPTQVRIVRSSAQSHTHWLSIHNTGQSKNNSSENGGHTVRAKTEPQFFLHQHDELCRIFRQCQAQSHRPGETCKPTRGGQATDPVYVGISPHSSVR